VIIWTRYRLHRALDHALYRDDLHRRLDAALDRQARARDAAFNEADHPRVQSGPEAGQFTSKGGGGGSSSGAANKPARPNIPKSEFPLTPKQQKAEQRFKNQVEANPEKYISKYKEKFGNVLNADNAKELSEDYNKDRSGGAAAVHETASWLVKQMYERELAKPAPKGKENLVVFTAGGAGSGKTTALEGTPNAKATMDQAQLVYDGTLRPAPKAAVKIDQALKAGKEAVVLYVYRDPVDAFVNGVLKRAARQEQEFGSGRTVPIGEFVAQHASVSKSMEELNAKYKDNPGFYLSVIDNSKGQGNAVPSTLEDLPPAPDAKELEGRLIGALNTAYEQGKISHKIYAATLGGGAKGEVGM
jgi:Zeta toxin